MKRLAFLIVLVAQFAFKCQAQTASAGLPYQLSGFGIVSAGDSRFAGQNSFVQSTETFIYQLNQQPLFKGRTAYAQNGAHAGDTCVVMTSSYNTLVYPYRPSAQNVQTTFLFIMEGINDARTAVALATWEACYQKYVYQAIADGFTPIVSTIYYDSSNTSTPPADIAIDTERLQMNTFIRDLQQITNLNGNVRIGLFDASSLLPNYSNVTDLTYYASPSVANSVTAYSIASNVITVTASNAFTAGQVVYLGGYTDTTQCADGETLTVSATGLSTSSFQAPISCPNATSSAAGFVHGMTFDGLHMSMQQVKYLLAPKANSDMGLFLTGTNVGPSPAQNVMNCQSGYCWFGPAIEVYANSASNNISIFRNAGGSEQVNIQGVTKAFTQYYTGTQFWQNGPVDSNDFKIRDGGSGAIAVDIISGTPTGAIVMSGSSASSNLAWSFPQIYGSGSVPTMVAGAAAGTSPTCTTVAGTNLSGTITCTTGTATTTGTLATVTFSATEFLAPQSCSLMPRNAATAPTSTAIYTTVPSTTAWTIAAASALTASTQYSWGYHCI